MPLKAAGKISGIWTYFPEKSQDTLPRYAAPCMPPGQVGEFRLGEGWRFTFRPGGGCHRKPLTIMAVSRMMKLWCRAIDLPGTYGAHFLRKIFGHIRRAPWGVGLARIRKAFSPFSPRATMGHWGQGRARMPAPRNGGGMYGSLQNAQRRNRNMRRHSAESRPPLFGTSMADSGIQEGMAQAVSPFRRRTPC